MPHRPRAHQIEDIARNYLREAFATVGWVVEDLHHDYGEDQLVRIFEKGEATPLIFFVQSKSTDGLEKLQIANGTLLSYPIKTAHLKSWNRLWEPVLITLCDVQTGTTYWQSVEAIVEANPGILETGKKTVQVHIPTSNKLDEAGIGKIRALTKSRFGRFEQEREGTKTLVSLVEETLGQPIDYDAQTGFLFVPDSKGEWWKKIVLFGVAAEAIQEMAREQGVEVIDWEWFTYQVFAQDSQHDPFGSLDEFKRYLRGERELIESE